MKVIHKFLLLTVVLLLVSLGTISATENVSDTPQTSDAPQTQDIVEKTITDDYTSADNNIKTNTQTNQNKAIVKNEIKKETRDVKQASPTFTITEAIYDQFFVSNGEIIVSTDLVRDGDTLNLKGDFTNKNFTADKQIILTSLDKDAILKNCSVLVTTSGSGSTVANLDINNTQDYTTGILVKDASNLTIVNNTVLVGGLHSYGIEANINNSIIKNNDVYTFDGNQDNRVHTAVVLCDSNYNTIANNTVRSDDANGIYLATYPGIDIHAGFGGNNWNNITGNYVVGYNSAWSYTIQIMGDHTIASENTVTGGFRGISSAGNDNIIISNDVDAWSEGIEATKNSVIQNNYVHVTNASDGIVVSEANATVKNNRIETLNGSGITLKEGNVTISGNTIISQGSTGIYGKGNYTRILIDNNDITSKEEGILFKRQSGSKGFDHISVTRNSIISEATYAIDFSEAPARTNTRPNITVRDSNVLSSANGTGLVNAYNPPAGQSVTELNDTNDVIHIGSGNYTNFFEEGVSNVNIRQNATVYLHGTFNNLDFRFDKKVHIIGVNCQINNGTIFLDEDAHGSTIKNIRIKNTEEDYNVYAIEVYRANNCIINNVTIDNYATSSSIGIFLYDNRGTTIANSTIKTSGDYLNNAILLYESNMNTIENNKINLNQSNIPREYDDEVQFGPEIGMIQEVLHNHGIILLYSSNNKLNKNNVTVTSMFNSYTAPSAEYKNSVVGIDMYFECNDNNVTNNNINVNSYGPYTYGMGVLGAQWGKSLRSLNASNNVFKNNNVSVTGGYYVTGFIAGRNSYKTLVESNNFKIVANKNSNSRGDYGYGVVLENSTTSTIKKNNINVDAAAVYSIEIFNSPSNKILENTIKANATYPYGVAAYLIEKNVISNNSITLRKVNNGDVSPDYHSDAIFLGDDGIYLMESCSNNNITYNAINTNADATVRLDATSRSNRVTENSLVAKDTFGDDSVTNLHTSNTVANNFIYFVNVTVSPLTSYIGETVTINATITSTTTNLQNLTATFILGTNEIGNSTVTNGVARLEYTITSFYRPTTYQISVSVKGNNFQNSTGIAQATFVKVPEKTVTKVDKVLKTVGSTATLTANITTATGGKIGVGQAEFYLDDTLLDTVDVNLGVASLNYPIAADAEYMVHTIRVKYLANNDYENSTGTNILGVQSVSSVAVANHTATLGENVNIKANVTSGSAKVTSGNVNILINNIEVANATISNGVVNKNIKVPTSFDKGTYNLKIVYPGNDTQSAASATAKITLNPMNPVFHYNKTGVVVGQNISIVLGIDNGLTGNNICLANNGNVSLKLNGQTLTDAGGNPIKGTVRNGTITFKFVAPSQLAGQNNLTFIYSGDSKFAQAEETFNDAFTIEKSDTNLYMYSRSGDTKGSTIKVSGKLQSYGNEVRGETVTIKVNGKTYTATTGGYGYFTVNHTITSYDDLNVTFTYAGSALYKGCTNSTVYTVKKPTNLYMYPRSGDSKGSTIKVSGKLQYNDGEGAKGEKVNITVNGKKYSATTGGYGYFTVNHTITSYDDLNVTFTYAGGSKYLPSTNSTVYTVKKPSNLYMYTRSGDAKGSTIKVSGKLQYNGEGIKGEKVTIKVNSKTYTATTAGYGYFTVNHTITSYDDLNVTFTYAGGKNYEASTNSTIYKVNGPTSLFIYSRTGDKKGSTIKVSGKLLCGEDGVKGEKVTIKVNGKTYTATTGGYGYFTVNHTITSYDDLNISMSYAGSSKYEATTNSTVYKVNGPTSLYIYPRSGDAKGSTIKVSGKLLCDGEGVKGEKVTIKVNGKTFTATTGGYGYFTINYTITSYDNLNISMSYAGSSKYEATTNSTVYAVKQPTNIYMYSRSGDKVGTTIKVSGKLQSNGEGVKGEKVNINVNGKTYTATTAGYGYFTVNYTITSNTNCNVTFTFNGSKLYEASTNSTVYTVKP